MSYPRTPWDTKLLEQAEQIALWSRDPSTKVGALIVRPDRTIASTGYNGFARGVEDREDRLLSRDQRLLFTIHAELNAILTAREPLHCYTLYCSHLPCAHCAAAIVQSGIKRVFSRVHADYELRWQDNLAASRDMFNEAGVQVVAIL